MAAAPAVVDHRAVPDVDPDHVAARDDRRVAPRIPEERRRRRVAGVGDVAVVRLRQRHRRAHSGRVGNGDDRHREAGVALGVDAKAAEVRVVGLNRDLDQPPALLDLPALELLQLAVRLLQLELDDRRRGCRVVG